MSLLLVIALVVYNLFQALPLLSWLCIAIKLAAIDCPRHLDSILTFIPRRLKLILHLCPNPLLLIFSQ
jgi:hypothetical protein